MFMWSFGPLLKTHCRTHSQYGFGVKTTNAQHVSTCQSLNNRLASLGRQPGLEQLLRGLEALLVVLSPLRSGVEKASILGMADCAQLRIHVAGVSAKLQLPNLAGPLKRMVPDTGKKAQRICCSFLSPEQPASSSLTAVTHSLRPLMKSPHINIHVRGRRAFNIRAISLFVSAQIES